MSQIFAAIPLWNWLVEPLQYESLVQAIWVSAFVGLVCAVLSCYITLKGWSLMGDVSHAVVPGVVVAYALGIPFAVGAFLFGFGATVAIGYVKSKTRLKEDAVIGVVFNRIFCLWLGASYQNSQQYRFVSHFVWQRPRNFATGYDSNYYCRHDYSGSDFTAAQRLAAVLF